MLAEAASEIIRLQPPPSARLAAALRRYLPAVILLPSGLLVWELVVRLLRVTKPYTEGAPAKHHAAIMGSQMAHPKEDVGTKGTMGVPYRWCMTSQPVWRSQPRPMKPYELSPL